jgi:hypothetical protein
MSAHDAIVDLPQQAIFDDFVVIFFSKLAGKVSTCRFFQAITYL